MDRRNVFVKLRVGETLLLLDRYIREALTLLGFHFQVWFASASRQTHEHTPEETTAGLFRRNLE